MKSCIGLKTSNTNFNTTSDFQDEKKYGLLSQLRRVVVSIGSNIAEDASRNIGKDFKQFLSLSNGSTYELETQLIIATNLRAIEKDKSKKPYQKVMELQKMFYTLSQ